MDDQTPQVGEALPDGEERIPVSGDTLTSEAAVTELPQRPQVNSMNLIEFLEHKAQMIRASAEHQAKAVEEQAASLRARAEAGEQHVVELLKHPFGHLAEMLRTYREHL